MRLPLGALLLAACLALSPPLLAGPAEPVFSDQYSLYQDSYNGFKIKIPVEFKLTQKGANTIWEGPQVDGFGTTIYVNTVEMKGVPPQALYESNLKAKKEDRNYTSITPVKVKFGKKTALGFTFSEAEHVPGSSETKAPDDHHRWHLLAFGNERFYTCGFTGGFQAFQDRLLQPIYKEVIASFELIPVK
jgi:hypothetical protein